MFSISFWTVTSSKAMENIHLPFNKGQISLITSFRLQSKMIVDMMNVEANNDNSYFGSIPSYHSPAGISHDMGSLSWLRQHQGKVFFLLHGFLYGSVPLWKSYCLGRVISEHLYFSKHYNLQDKMKFELGILHFSVVIIKNPFLPLLPTHNNNSDRFNIAFNLSPKL